MKPFGSYPLTQKQARARQIGFGVLAIGLGLAGAAQAQPGPTAVELKHFIGRVEVIAENRADVEITVAHGNNKLPQPKISTSGDRLVMDGGLNGLNHGINFNFFDGHSESGPKGMMTISGYGTYALKDLPVITVHTPMDVHLTASGTAFGHIGASHSLKLVNSGDGDWRVDPVATQVDATNAGSGDIHLATCGDVTLNTAGSGDFTIGDIQSIRTSQAGSGDIKVGHIYGPAHISLAASGDFTAQMVRGDTDISIAGSGDVTIREGSAPHFKATIAGSGDIRFGGTAGDVSASIAGSGDIHVAHATGHISKQVMGSGDINVGQ